MPAEVMERLTALRQALRAAAKEDATAAILAFLRSGLDAGTGLRFEVAMEGRLEGAPTVRVALLDMLGQLDPKLAAGYAEEAVFTAMASSDEWAVSLRNYVWNNANLKNHARIAELTHRLLRHQPWHENTTDGYLEAFDLAVYFNDGWAFEEMAAMNTRHREGNGLGWGSFLTLDRMMLAGPETRARQMLESEPLNILPGGTRAQLMARLDPRDKAQLALLERYLGRADLATDEIQRFMELYPNHNLAAAPALVTPMRASFRTLRDGALVDLEALAVVEGWISREALSPEARRQLGVLRARLLRYRDVIDGAIARGEFSLQ